MGDDLLGLIRSLEMRAFVAQFACGLRSGIDIACQNHSDGRQPFRLLAGSGIRHVDCRSWPVADWQV